MIREVRSTLIPISKPNLGEGRTAYVQLNPTALGTAMLPLRLDLAKGVRDISLTTNDRTSDPVYASNSSGREGVTPPALHPATPPPWGWSENLDFDPQPACSFMQVPARITPNTGPPLQGDTAIVIHR